ncbi:hypothetical protein FQN60_001981, partial [Etheostoma spectabile]
MTSYQELTAEGESSPLFVGFCRAKEVINRDLDGRTHPELGSRDEEGKLDVKVAPGFNSPHPRPPPSRETLEGFSTLACPLSSRVPWRCRAQGQGSPGRGFCVSNNNETLRSGVETLTEQIHIYSRNCPEIHATTGSSAGSDCNVAYMDVSRKTFEWMRVKRNQHRPG